MAGHMLRLMGIFSHPDRATLVLVRTGFGDKPTFSGFSNYESLGLILHEQTYSLPPFLSTYGSRCRWGSRVRAPRPQHPCPHLVTGTERDWAGLRGSKRGPSEHMVRKRSEGKLGSRRLRPWNAVLPRWRNGQLTPQAITVGNVITAGNEGPLV